MGQVLRSWQQIAGYVGKGLRTVQRWEREIDFPVHRTGKDRRTVLAYPEEINRWMHRAQPVVSAATVVQGELARRRAEVARLRDQVERAHEQTFTLYSMISEFKARRSRTNSDCKSTPQNRV